MVNGSRRGAGHGAAHRLVPALAPLVLTSTVAAFTSHEHKTVGDDGARVVGEYIDSTGAYMCSTSDAPNCLDELDVERLKELIPGQGAISYGEMVAAVDYVLNPIKHLERQGDIACHPAAIDELHLRAVEHKRLIGAFRASTNNESHFQGELLMSLWFWHAAAVQAATGGECLPRADLALDDIPDEQQETDTLVGAMVLNAVSEHYLQDIFAPGHVMTLRDTLNDASALATHDRYNILGAALHVNESRWHNELEPLLAAAVAAGVEGLDAEEIEAAAKRIGETLRIELWGDGNLDRSPEQRVFMTLLAARSILDVIEAYVTGVPNNHFGQYSWQQMRIHEDALELPRATIPYGEYPVRRRTNKKLPHGTILGLGFWGQGFFEGSGETTFRQGIDLELSTGILAPGRKLPTGEIVPRFYQWDATAGYSWFDSSAHSGHGPTARLTLSIPKLDMRFSAEAAYRRLRGQGGVRVSKPGFGLRWGVGFSLVSVYLGAGVDHFITTAGQVERGPTVRFGLEFLTPSTRIPGVSKLAKARLRKKRKKSLSEEGAVKTVTPDEGGGREPAQGEREADAPPEEDDGLNAPTGEGETGPSPGETELSARFRGPTHPGTTRASDYSDALLDRRVRQRPLSASTYSVTIA